MDLHRARQHIKAMAHRETENALFERPGAVRLLKWVRPFVFFCFFVNAGVASIVKGVRYGAGVAVEVVVANDDSASSEGRGASGGGGG